MPRVTLYHLTPPVRLPIIEEQGLRTRADLSGLLGPVDGIDTDAPGTYAHGKRVSGYLSREQARTRVGEHGAGLLIYSVDPGKALAAPASARAASVDEYWHAAAPLTEWLDGGVPDDLEVHTNVGIRAKHLQLCAPLLTAEQLGEYAPLVAAIADEDRLSAKALMHLAVIDSDGDFDSPAFNAACALAWRDTPDSERLSKELIELDPDKIASAALAEFGAAAPEATARLREVLDQTREFADEHGITAAKGVMTRTAYILDQIPEG